MTKFNKNALFAALKPKIEVVKIEGFGGLAIGQLTVDQIEGLRADLKKTDKVDDFGLRLVQLSVLDDEGNRVFDDSDLAALHTSSNSAMDNLVSEALRVNGFKKAADSKN